MFKKIFLTMVIFAISLSYIPDIKANTENFDMSGKIYNKWLYQNNTSMGTTNLGTPLWGDNFSGDNGVGSEFELNINGSVSKFVKAGVRIQSRFGSVWQDWWENGDLKPEHYDNPDSSGESMGMNHADYIKLRGYWIRIAPPIPTVKSILVGTSDMGMFNPWSIGKSRYIDRDNGKGVFIEGSYGPINNYTFGIVALSKLFAGPYWTTGIQDPAWSSTSDIPLTSKPFWTNDYAYGIKIRTNPLIWSTTLELIVTTTLDWEADIYDPDTEGTLNPNPNPENDSKNGNVDLEYRYNNTVVTLEAQSDPIDYLGVNFLIGFSDNRLNKLYTANGSANNQGFSPIVYDNVNDFAFRGRVEINDPLEVGLTGKIEYFNIGEDWNSILGSRREADVLITDGLLEGGQLPTLNLANEFIDFDSEWYESCIGWHGITTILDYLSGNLQLSGEYTFLNYNTNEQGRLVNNTQVIDPFTGQEVTVEAVYPKFSATMGDGYTDTDVFDYANVSDRGRDPRSVYHDNQDRHTHIAVGKGRYVIDVGRGIELNAKIKYIRDIDNRNITRDDDNYLGNIWIFRPSIGYQFTDELKLELGTQIDRWYENQRSGDESGGYDDYKTEKEKVFFIASYNFAGAVFKYRLEYLDKDRNKTIGATCEEDKTIWNIIRSKASLEVSW